MPRTTHQYLTVQLPGSKKIEICERRIGARARFNCIAFTSSEQAADKIVDALNMHQGEIEKIELPPQRVLEGVRQELAAEIKRRNEASDKLRAAEQRDRESRRKIDDLNYQLRNSKRQVEDLQRRLNDAINPTPRKEPA